MNIDTMYSMFHMNVVVIYCICIFVSLRDFNMAEIGISLQTINVVVWMSSLESITSIKSHVDAITKFITTEETSKQECRHTKLGEKYTGKKSTTAAGLTCDYWVNQTGMSNEDLEEKY